MIGFGQRHAGQGPRPDLSLVFPVFDEEGNLPELIRTAREIGAWLTPDFEIVVVDDGSRDASADIARGWATLDPRVRLVRHHSNAGYGAALRTGLEAARGELIFFSDADLQFDLAELEKLLEHTGDYDIVAGYRAPRRDPWPRLVLAWGWGVLVRALFDLQVRDIDCAFKVFRRHVIERLDTESLGAFINTELLVRARTAGFRIHQVPVAHRRRRHGRQSGANPRVIAKALAELVRLHRGLRGEARRSQGVEHGAPLMTRSQGVEHGAPLAERSQGVEHGAPLMRRSQGVEHGAPSAGRSQSVEHDAPWAGRSQSVEHRASRRTRA